MAKGGTVDDTRGVLANELVAMREDCENGIAYLLYFCRGRFSFGKGIKEVSARGGPGWGRGGAEKAGSRQLATHYTFSSVSPVPC